MSKIYKSLFLSFIAYFMSSVLISLYAMGSGSGSSNSNTPAPFSSSSKSTVNLTDAKIKIQAKNFRGAIPVLEQIVIDDPKNADAFNYLGYSYRMSGDKQKSYDAYQKALAIDPMHKGANEYLGELYLEMNNPGKAEERLAILKSACTNCIEYTTLEASILKFKTTTKN
ncbi:MAG: tetratricopeptide repeat protein [Alphaproteobacteria bacterium]|nr:tetratricopeptide repeat protein [Alphaproteobacteria bacterium]